jgi:alpha-amylase
VYYGDESARPLEIPGAEGDANMRSFMNWDDIANNPQTKKVLAHYQKLGQFRKNHPVIGAGGHSMITESPYVFERTFDTDAVVIGLDLPKGKKTIMIADVFREGAKVRDAYSGKTAKVQAGNVELDTEFDIVLLEKI